MGKRGKNPVLTRPAQKLVSVLSNTYWAAVIDWSLPLKRRSSGRPVDRPKNDRLSYRTRTGRAVLLKKLDMSAQPISAEDRQLLGKLRDLLLEQHKLLLDLERAEYEKANGAIAGPGPFLALAMNHPDFAWLKQISTMVIEIDEALSRRSKAGQPVANAIVAQAREMLRPREQGSSFQVRYHQALQESPDIVILQCRIEKLLGI
jgi:hypothetical protein